MRSSYLIWCCRKEQQWEPPEMVPLRVPSTVPPSADLVSTQQKPNKDKKESSREAALDFLATINVEPNLASLPHRPIRRDPEEEYVTLAEEAEEFDDHWLSPPSEPDGTDEGLEHPMLF